jgi:uncharacterized membrane protein YphA (DoxX/SURF4 family)
MTRMEILLLVIRIFLAATFALSSVAKLLDLPGSRKTLIDSKVPACHVATQYQERPVSTCIALA